MKKFLASILLIISTLFIMNFCLAQTDNGKKITAGTINVTVNLKGTAPNVKNITFTLIVKSGYIFKTIEKEIPKDTELKRPEGSTESYKAEVTFENVPLDEKYTYTLKVNAVGNCTNAHITLPTEKLKSSMHNIAVIFNPNNCKFEDLVVQ